MIRVRVAARGGTLLDKVNEMIDRQDAKVSFSLLCVLAPLRWTVLHPQAA